MNNNLGTPSSELQINFGVLQIDTENSATGLNVCGIIPPMIKFQSQSRFEPVMNMGKVRSRSYLKSPIFRKH